MSGKTIVAFAGLAHPDDFLEMVEGLGAHVIQFEAFPDHHSFTQHEIELLASKRQSSDADFLLTTEKDWVRIEGNIQGDLDIAVLTIKIGLLEGKDIFFDIIREGILGTVS